VSLRRHVAAPATDLDRDLLIETGPNSVTYWYDAVRTDRHIYAELEDGNPATPLQLEMYDLRADPFQRFSVAASPTHARERAALAARLRALRNCAGASCR
jgi:hypothetical protein